LPVTELNWLFDHWDKLGLNDAPIRSHQTEAMDASGSGNCAVGGISQNTQ
jgi:hypothetical protein